jgi:serine phosphatase RsbU (regulator of sigma subunit)
VTRQRGLSVAQRTRSIDASAGGDFVLLLPLQDGASMLAIGDTCGHGVAAAEQANDAVSLVERTSRTYLRPAAVLLALNALMLRSPRAVHAADATTAMFIASFNRDRTEFTYASAGHPTGYLITADDLHPLPSTGPLLGVVEAVYRERSFAVVPGNTLVAATDGFTEARNAKGDFFQETMHAEVRDACDPSSVATSLRRVEALAQRFADHCFVDDRALVVARTHALAAT